MKKHYLKLLSFFLCFFLTFSFLGSYSFCFASSVSSTSPFGDFKSFHTPEETWDFCSHYMLEIVDAVTGLIPQVGHTEFAAHFRDCIRRNKQFENETECYEWMQDGNLLIDKPDDTSNFTEVYFSDEFLNILRDAVETYKNDCDNKQVFSWLTSTTPSDILYASSFSSLDNFNYVKGRFENLCNMYDYVGVVAWDTEYAVCQGYTVSQLGIVNKTCYVDWLNIATVNADTDKEIPTFVLDIGERREYRFSSWLQMWQSDTFGVNQLWFPRGGHHVIDHWHQFTPPYYGEGLPWGTSFKGVFLLTAKRSYLRNFKTLDDLKNWQGSTWRAPYYTHDPSLTGNTITAQQLNNGVNYGDIIGGDKNIIIIPGPGNPIQLPSPDPGSGGGGGGGTDPNPNPNPDPNPSPSPSWDFSGLLSALFKLIEAIFNLFTSLISKIADLVASLITSVTGIINSLLDLFNNNAIGLLGNVLSFLPADVTKLITLTFSLGCLIAIIKFFRG